MYSLKRDFDTVNGQVEEPLAFDFGSFEAVTGSDTASGRQVPCSSQQFVDTDSVRRENSWLDVPLDQIWPSFSEILVGFDPNSQPIAPFSSQPLDELEYPSLDQLVIDNGVQLWASESLEAPQPQRLDGPLICFGMVYRAGVQLSGNMITLDKRVKDEAQKTKAKRLQFKLSDKDNNFVLTFADGLLLGILSKELGGALRDAIGNLDLECDAFIDTTALSDRISLSKKSKDAIVRADIYVYGQNAHFMAIGQLFSSKKVFLQKPDHPRRGYAYQNPQFLELPGFELGQGIMDLEDSTTVNRDQSEAEDLDQTVTNVFADLHRGYTLERNSGTRWLKTALLEHQQTGLSFMLQREEGPIPEEFRLWQPKKVDDDIWYSHEITKRRSRVEVDETGGGILADEMGMGKTLSILALITNTLGQAHQWAEVSDTNGEVVNSKIASAGTLVLVPSALLIDEWYKEIAKHLSEPLRTIKYHGSDRLRDPKILANANIVVTTYHVLITEYRKKDTPLHEVMWYRVVLDEAHIIRRQATAFYHAVYELEAKHRWCLTGTPIQNRLEDVGSLIAFLRIRPFDSLAMFRRFIAIPFAEGNKQRAIAIRNLTKLLDAVSLRRTKDLLHLPKRVERVQPVDFTEKERIQYDQTLQRMNRRMREHESVEYADSRFGLFHIQLQLRILCNHGTFQDPFSWAQLDSRDIKEAAMNMMQDSSEIRCSVCRQAMPVFAAKQFDTAGDYGCNHAICPDCLDEVGNVDTLRPGFSPNCPLCVTRSAKRVRSERLPGEVSYFQPSGYLKTEGYSSKMARLVVDVQEALWSTKSIVFTSWTSTLDLVSKHFNKANIPFVRIDGTCALRRRQEILSNLVKEDTVPVLIMTTGTGAFGLNLTFANRVFLVEPQWNPSVENQAIARAQRIGQNQSVNVIRYMVRGTIEQEMGSQQKGKLKMAALGNATSGSKAKQSPIAET